MKEWYLQTILTKALLMIHRCEWLKIPSHAHALAFARMTLHMRADTISQLIVSNDSNRN